MLRLVTTYYLEMLSADQLRPATRRSSDLSVSQAPRDGEVNRTLYCTAGADWSWTDRLVWTAGQWDEYAQRPELETWLASLDGATAGYFELESQPGGNVEIAYFGLLPQYIGQGLGGALLTAAVERAWATGANRVWVHTCSLDHRHAAKNYLARGFHIYRSITRPKSPS
jgi:GNAT superfamily N-acetyltransferase